LACGTSYDYRVRAANTVGESAFSSTDSSTTTVCSPDAPSGLSATAASGSQINLSWTDNSSDETGFEIERSLSGNGTWTQIAAVDADVTTYQDTGLACGTAYDYRGRATNAGGDSAYSATASATTAACPGAPAAPTGLQAGEVTTQAVTLRWTDNSLDETGFTVQRSSGAMEDWADLGTTAADVTAYQDVTVACGTTYTYRVQAYNAIGDSAFSNVLEVSTGDCPSGKYRVYLPSVLRAPGVNAVSEAAGGLASAESSRDVGDSAVRSDVFDLRMVSWTRTAVADARWAVCSLAP
jgi:fibronectin type 3 domain-containing protein